MRWFAATSVVLAANLLRGQTAAPPKFEIADVHASPPRGDRYVRRYGLRDSRYEIDNATMVDLIVAAYGVESNQVLGGPNWLEWDRFDVSAKAPPGATRATTLQMLQALLADRFQLVAHQDNMPLPAYALSVGKGKPKLKAATGSGNSGCRPGPPEPGSELMGLTCRNVSMDLLARMLSGFGAGLSRCSSGGLHGTHRLMGFRCEMDTACAAATRG
jgi:uncharacterized protein (TIGR03435 family)